MSASNCFVHGNIRVQCQCLEQKTYWLHNYLTYLLVNDAKGRSTYGIAHLLAPPCFGVGRFSYSMVFRSFGNGISIPLVYAWPPHIHHERDTNYSLSYLSVLSSYFRSLKPKACQTRDQEPTCWVGPSSGGGEIILQQRKCEPRLHTRLNCVVEDCLGMSVILRHFFIFIFILTI